MSNKSFVVSLLLFAIMISVSSFGIGKFMNRSIARAMTMSAKDTAEKLIKENKVMVFSKSYW